MIFSAFNKEKSEEFKNLKYHAWHVAAMLRAKKIPDFEKFMEPGKKRKGRKGIDETALKAAFKRWNKENDNSR